jgi:hypothetical protein
VTDTTSPSQQPFSTGPDLSPDPVPVSAPVVKPGGKSSRAINILLGVAVAVAIGGVAFAVGRGTAPAANAAGTLPRGGQFFNGGNGNGGAGNGPNQGGPGAFATGGLTVEGTVTAMDGDSLTIRTANGQEITVSTNGDTTYHQQAAATANDVSTGSNVLVRLDGFRGRFGGGGGGQGASPAPSGAPGTTATDVTVVP